MPPISFRALSFDQSLPGPGKWMALAMPAHNRALRNPRVKRDKGRLSPCGPKEEPPVVGKPQTLKCLLVSGQEPSTTRPAVSAQVVPCRGSGGHYMLPGASPHPDSTMPRVSFKGSSLRGGSTVAPSRSHNSLQPPWLLEQEGCWGSSACLGLGFQVPLLPVWQGSSGHTIWGSGREEKTKSLLVPAGLSVATYQSARGDGLGSIAHPDKGRLPCHR